MGFEYDRFLAGFVGGLSFQLLHPLDVLRVRFQSNDLSRFRNVPEFASYGELLRKMAQREGLWALYKGVTFSLFVNTLLGLFFATNEAVKRALSRLRGLRDRPVLVTLLSPTLCSLALALVFNPFTVVKTWKLLDQNKLGETRSVRQLARHIRRTQGLRGFYRGYLITFTVGLNGTLTVFFNDSFKLAHPHFYDSKLGNFVVGGLARMLSSTLVYPLSTVRTRVMQNQVFSGLDGPKYAGVADCFRQTYAHEGVAGFYRGLLASMPRAFLSSGMMFFAYHQTYKWLRGRGAVSPIK